MNAYTVIVLYPDYMTDRFGHETYMAHVSAESPELAATAAQREAAAAQECDDECPEDFYVLATFEGHLNNIYRNPV